MIDSEQLESGDALDKNFRDAASDEIERFRREHIQRTGDRPARVPKHGYTAWAGLGILLTK